MVRTTLFLNLYLIYKKKRYGKERFNKENSIGIG
jgi:hypothetical protein